MSSLVRMMATWVPAGLLRRMGALQFSHPLIARGIVSVSRSIRYGDGTIRRGHGAGLRFNCGGSNAGYALGTSEPSIQDVFARCLRPGDTVYDVGANVGFFAVLAARFVGSEGRVVAFEPLPSSADMVRYNARQNGFETITVIEAAAWESSGEAELLLLPESTATKLARLTDEQGASPQTFFR
jgi:hypothetical protein